MLTFLFNVYGKLLLTSIFLKVIRYTCSLAGLTLKDVLVAPELKEAQGVSFFAEGQIHNAITKNQIKRSWFSFSDVFRRFSVVILAFLYVLLTQPLHFGYYVFNYHRISYGITPAVFSVIVLPFVPGLILLEVVCKAVIGKSSMFLPYDRADDWEADSNLFFLNNLPFNAKVLYDTWQVLGYILSSYFIVGTNDEGIKVTYWDTEKTDKVFWRKKLCDAGGRVPQEVGFWKDGKHEVIENIAEFDHILVKVTNSCLGIGDKFLSRDKDYKDAGDIVDILQHEYEGKTCILMEVVEPLPSLGVHSLHLLAVKDGQGRVHVLDIMVWTGATTKSTHSATQSYMIDYLSGNAVAPGHWYGPSFQKSSTEKLGLHYPCMEKMIATVVKAHQNVEYDWSSAIGWDCMVTDKGDIVFFEGNVATGRLMIRIFLSFKNFLYYITFLS